LLHCDTVTFRMEQRAAVAEYELLLLLLVLLLQQLLLIFVYPDKFFQSYRGVRPSSRK